MLKYRKTFYPNGGIIKDNTTLTEIRATSAVCVYDELVFHDNPEDVKWLHEHMQEFAANDAKALCEYFGIPFKDPYAAAQPPKEEKPTETKVLYAVQVGAYANRENAEKMAEKLKEKGFAAYITKK